MASLAGKPEYRPMSVREFLDLEIEGRAELEDGVLYMMSGGSALHSAIIVNVTAALREKLRGSGCRPMSSDMAVQTGEATVRMPDVSVYCGFPLSVGQEKQKLLGDPIVVFEVLSPSTRAFDLRTKVSEYRSLPGLKAAAFVDPEARRVRLFERTGGDNWADLWIEQGLDVTIASLGITLSASEIFALD